MNAIDSKHSVSYVIIRKDKAASDERLAKPNNRGRKILANKMRPDKSLPLQNLDWNPPGPDGKSTILETGCGGLEVATCNENTQQEAHKHLLATEIYTVLEGEMNIKVDGTVKTMKQGDEIVVLPGTAHEIVPKGKFLTRVHSIDCHGDNDKYDV
ncbi:MAG: cupin domain-containing protein [Desulfobacterium sp.]|nr:cupin domain-containing protein [Desulfobacterium sp.]MBU3948655.1 cupin domain-containing protein [Pseudomonadota bacterium]MBU4009158.1 cupin domain-containing protein [Pseudomonadota bacterium]MBU4036553.1 cupin domain-containing protein [Pseudomonadota bacterium]